MLQPFIIHRTLQIYLRQTIFCSQVESEVKKDSSLRMLLRSKKP